jgi:hypothetical protein
MPLNIILSPVLIVAKSCPPVIVKSVHVEPSSVEYDRDRLAGDLALAILIVLLSANDSIVK